MHRPASLFASGHGEAELYFRGAEMVGVRALERWLGCSCGLSGETFRLLMPLNARDAII